METVVYGDLLFLVNFCMDFQCLFLTAKCMRQRFFVGRAALSAALGALYASAALFVTLPRGAAFLLDVAVCALMCAIAFFSAGRARATLRAIGIYFVVSLAIGGVMSGVASLLDRADLPPTDGGDQLSFAAFLLLAATGGLSTYFWGRYCQGRAKGRTASVTIELFGRRASLRGMVDTANLLHDPIGGAPVILMPLAVAAALLPTALLESARAGDPLLLESLPHEWARRVRLIPANGVGGSRLLLALKADRITLAEGRGVRDVEALVAPCELSIPCDEYQALLPAALLQY